MKLEDLDQFERFMIWDFEDAPAYLTAWNKETALRERLYLDRSGRLTSSFPIGRTIPEAVGLPTKEEVLSMLCDHRFTAD